MTKHRCNTFVLVLYADITISNCLQVESFLLHFWQGMPSHMLPVLASDVVVDLVAHCDTLLYRVISNVLITSPLQNLPDR